MIKYNQIHKVIEAKHPDGSTIPCDITFVKRSNGEIRAFKNVTYVNKSAAKNMIRFRFPDGSFKEIKKLAIIKLNNNEIEF